MKSIDVAHSVCNTPAEQADGDGWSRCWDEGVTPWDLGQPTPAVVELVQMGTLPRDGATATVLVPGCGAVGTFYFYA